MSNDTLLEAIENLINEIEGKLQNEMKKQDPDSDALKEWLKSLYQKRSEIINRKTKN